MDEVEAEQGEAEEDEVVISGSDAPPSGNDKTISFEAMPVTEPKKVDAFKLKQHLASRLARGIVKLLIKRYPQHMNELMLDEEDEDIIDDALNSVLIRALKSMGINIEYGGIVVLVVLIILPRVYIIIEEEIGKAKLVKNKPKQAYEVI